jgi:hypothetical protein
VFEPLGKYEIEMSKYLRHGLLGIDISTVRDLQGKISYCCGQLPVGYPFCRWGSNDGYRNMGVWIEAAARAVGR